MNTTITKQKHILEIQNAIIKKSNSLTASNLLNQSILKTL